MFDKAMKNTFHSSNVEDLKELESRRNNVIQEFISKIGNANFKSSFIYMNNSLAAKNLFDDTYYIGLNPITVHLLDNFTSFESFPEVQQVSKGDKIAEIEGEWGKINISSPVNFKWLGKLPNFKEYSINEKWFGLVEISRDDIEKASVSVSNFHKDIVNLTKELNSFIINSPDVGETMLDGGREIRFLYQSIGREKYREILTKCFVASY
jgi:hypothetical protein